MNILVIAGVVLFLFIILKVIFKTIKLAFYLTVLVVGGVVGLHFYSPQTIDSIIGSETHAKVTAFVTNKVNEGVDVATEKTKELVDSKLSN